MLCYVADNQIKLYLDENAPFGVGYDGTLYERACPGDVQGTNYPAGWLRGIDPSPFGLQTLAIVGDTTQDPFHITSYVDSVIAGQATRTYSRVLKDVEVNRNFLYEQVSKLRTQKETGAFTFGPITLQLDGDTTTKIGQAIQLMDKNPALTNINWKVGPAQFVQLNKDTMNSLGVAVGNYVQDLFSANMLHCNTIGTLTAAQCATYDITAGWPSNGA